MAQKKVTEFDDFAEPSEGVQQEVQSPPQAVQGGMSLREYLERYCPTWDKYQRAWINATNPDLVIRTKEEWDERAKNL